MAPHDDRRRPAALNLTPSRSSSEGSFTTTSSLKAPRTPRFAEATTIHSPVEQANSNPFGGRDERSHVAQAQPADVGFGYINDDPRTQTVNMPMTPKSPLKSAMRIPGTPARRMIENPLSPTFREEDILESREKSTEKEQARDLGIKYKVRMAKFALRGVSFSCSLIILAMLSSSFAIFHATKGLAPQNGLPAWASGTQTWPQYLVLAVACVSLAICILIFVGYCRGGHHRAEKVGVYYTLFAVGWFIVSMIMWAAAAGVLQFTRNNSKNQDMWGWSCVQNHRSELFQDKVDYALVCRLQNWSLICIIIEIVIDVITITLYSVVFYRYYTKRRLHKTMDMRDRARSDLYLAQLRSQSAPNTPGFGPKSPAFSQYAMSPRFPPSAYKSLSDISEGPVFTPGVAQEPPSAFAAQVKPAATPSFKLQAPPLKAPKATPKLGQGAFRTPTTPTLPDNSFSFNAHGPMAPGEQQYDAVPIPGAYADAAPR
ncbi:Uu.00g043540.m01.CDS01 [Anthostomella pinea]|uniref:Uu.00g043540.m01.CDS01 n=1 Tax=Anthostomella pinea TaxID=933095 RepID=A0AAI8VAT4_9PEZI|nr:Uu.00g043540.m01.CDS01 [Anthostomella pinea]